MTTTKDTAQDFGSLVTFLSPFPGKTAAKITEYLVGIGATTEDGSRVRKGFIDVIANLLSPKLPPLISALRGAYRRYRQGAPMNPLEMALTAYTQGHPDAYGPQSLTETTLGFARKLGLLANEEQYGAVLGVLKEARSGTRDDVATYLQRLWTVFGKELPSATLTDTDVGNYILTQRNDAAERGDYDTAMRFGEILINLHAPDAQKSQAILCLEAGRQCIADGKEDDSRVPLDRAFELHDYVPNANDFHIDLASQFFQAKRPDKALTALTYTPVVDFGRRPLVLMHSCLAKAATTPDVLQREELLTAVVSGKKYLLSYAEQYNPTLMRRLSTIDTAILKIRRAEYVALEERVEELEVALSQAQEALEYDQPETERTQDEVEKAGELRRKDVARPDDVTTHESVPPTPIDLRGYTPETLLPKLLGCDDRDLQQLIHDLHIPTRINSTRNLPKVFIENYFASMDALSRLNINDIFSHELRIQRYLRAHLKGVGFSTPGEISDIRRAVLDYQTMLRTDHATAAQLEDLETLTPPQLYELALQYGLTDQLNYTPEHPKVGQCTPGPKGLRTLLPTVIGEKPETTLLYAWYSNNITVEHFLDRHRVRSDPDHRTDICIIANGTDHLRRASIDIIRNTLKIEEYATVRARYTFGIPRQEEAEKMLHAMCRTELGMITYT